MRAPCSVNWLRKVGSSSEVSGALVFALFLVLAALTSMPASAAKDSQFGAWSLRCADGVDATSQPQSASSQNKTSSQCELVLSVRSNGRELAELAVGVPAQAPDKLVVAGRTPLGVLLSEPMRLGAQQDASQLQGQSQDQPSAEPIDLAFFTCLSNGCLARALVPGDKLQPLAKLDVVHLSFRERNGRTLTIVVPTKGLDQALAHLTNQAAAE